MKTLGKFLLDINLTKWLSRCEGSFHKAKGKDNYKVKMMLEGSKLKNKEEKPKLNFRMETRKTKQEHDTKSKNGMTMEE